MWTVLAMMLVVIGVAVVAAQLSPDVREALATAKNLYVATKRSRRQSQQSVADLVHGGRRRHLLHHRTDQLQGEADRQGKPDL